MPDRLYLHFRGRGVSQGFEAMELGEVALSSLPRVLLPLALMF